MGIPDEDVRLRQMYKRGERKVVSGSHATLSGRR